MFSGKVPEFFYIFCNVIREIHLQLTGENVNDVRESSLTSLKEKKHCASFLRYDISSGLSSALKKKKKIQGRS